MDGIGGRSLYDCLALLALIVHEFCGRGGARSRKSPFDVG